MITTDLCFKCSNKDSILCSICGIAKDGAREHFNQKPITNADRIRSMTDEELAHWMYKHVTCRYCPCNPCISYDDIDKAGNIKCNPCEQILLAWLRKEATDG